MLTCLSCLSYALFSAPVRIKIQFVRVLVLCKTPLAPLICCVLITPSLFSFEYTSACNNKSLQCSITLNQIVLVCRIVILNIYIVLKKELYWKTQYVIGPTLTSQLLIHIHCVQRVIVLASSTPQHLVHSTVQQLLRYGEGYCHLNMQVLTIIEPCLASEERTSKGKYQPGI